VNSYTEMLNLLTSGARPDTDPSLLAAHQRDLLLRQIGVAAALFAEAHEAKVAGTPLRAMPLAVRYYTGLVGPLPNESPDCQILELATWLRARVRLHDDAEDLLFELPDDDESDPLHPDRVFDLLHFEAELQRGVDRSLRSLLSDTTSTAGSPAQPSPPTGT
jgi:hypothetical protein